jgi:hypothetical protein
MTVLRPNVVVADTNATMEGLLFVIKKFPYNTPRGNCEAFRSSSSVNEDVSHSHSSLYLSVQVIVRFEALYSYYYP